jgi:uncharacterized membrane protein HdeD (DUF308 family)
MAAGNLTENTFHHWWVWELRGVAALLFGIAAFAWPGITLAVLIWFFGAYALVSGAFTIVSAVSHRRDYSHWWVMLLQGAVSIAAGIVAYFYTGLTAIALTYLVAAWALVTGCLEVGAAVQWHRLTEHAGLFVLSGVVSILFGLLALFNPVAGALGLMWMIGFYMMINGILLMAFGFRVRHWGVSMAGGRMHPV